MTCKDCIHYDACDISSVYFGDTVGSERFREYGRKENIELDCDSFKDKSHFVELPCKLNTIFYYLNEEDEIKRCKATCISIFNNIEELCIKVVCIDDDDCYNCRKHGDCTHEFIKSKMEEMGFYFSLKEAEKALKEQVGEK